MSFGKNLTLQFKKVVYQIQTDRPAYALHKAPVTVCQDDAGKVAILYKGKLLAYTLFHKQEPQAEVVTPKQIDFALRNQSKAHKPAPNHPWYRTPATPLHKKFQVPPPPAAGAPEPKGDISIQPEKGTF